MDYARQVAGRNPDSSNHNQDSATTAQDRSPIPKHVYLVKCRGNHRRQVEAVHQYSFLGSGLTSCHCAVMKREGVPGIDGTKGGTLGREYRRARLGCRMDGGGRREVALWD